MNKPNDSMIFNAIEEAFAEARKATNEYVKANGDNWWPCGFAWVTVKPATSRVAKILKDRYQASKAYGGGIQIWNPSGHMTQQMDAKQAGARAFAKVLKDQLNINCYAECRMD